MGSNCCKSTRVHVEEEGKDDPGVSFEFSKSEFEAFGNQKLYQWRLGELIGRGTSGDVYQAMDDDTGQLLAVKIVRLNRNPNIAEKQFHNLSQEISLLKSLRHVHIVRYLQTEVELDQRKVKILLEYIPGGSLRMILEKYGGLSQKVIKTYAYQIIKGLQYLHNHQVMHRDLKSANILITDDAIVKLIDFGCSKKINDGEISMSLIGSPYWMAPEVALQQGHSYSSDIWSFGCLLIEMCKGSPPWSEYSNKAVEVLKLICTPEKLPNFPECPAPLLDLIKLCMNRTPEERPTADQILRHHYFFNSSASASYSVNSKNSSFTWYENGDKNEKRQSLLG